MLGLWYSGCMLTEIAAAVGCSTSAAFSKSRRLGAELAQRAGVNDPRQAAEAPAERAGGGARPLLRLSTSTAGR